MNKNLKGVIAVGLIAVIGFFVYKKLSKGTKTGSGVGGQKSRDVVKNYLFSTYGYSKEREDFARTMTQDYADAWANAIMNGKTTFIHNGNTIVTATGRVQQ